MNADNRDGYNQADDKLFQSLAEQLKIPLMHISQAAELHRLGRLADVSRIETVADMALRLVDSYLLSCRLNTGQQQLLLEPVSVSSVLYAAAERLDGFARQYACAVELRISGKHGPVMADRGSLEAAITALGYSFIESQAAREGRSRLVLSAYRSAFGITAGAYGPDAGLSADKLRRARRLQGSARQPLADFSQSSNAGLFIADSLINAMDSRLKVSKRGNLNGLAATFMPSPQLELVSL